MQRNTLNVLLTVFAPHSRRGNETLGVGLRMIFFSWGWKWVEQSTADVVTDQHDVIPKPRNRIT